MCVCWIFNLFRDRIEIYEIFKIRDLENSHFRTWCEFPRRVKSTYFKSEFNIFESKSGLYQKFNAMFIIRDSKCLYFDTSPFKIPNLGTWGKNVFIWGKNNKINKLCHLPA